MEEATAAEDARVRLLKAGAAEEELEAIFSRALVMVLPVEEPSQEHAERGRLLLDGHVVAPGHGTHAWNRLISIAGEAARLRLAYSIEGWLEALRAGDIPLVTEVEQSRAAQLLVRKQAMDEYKKRLTLFGEQLDLTELGVPIPPIPLDEVDSGMGVRDPQSDDRSDWSLLWSFRRRGRVLLTGLPGGGKTIALRRLSRDWLSHESWSVPIVGSLKRLARDTRVSHRPLRDLLLEQAKEVVDETDRLLVLDALTEAMDSGNALLMLDGLDEAANRAVQLAGALVQLVASLHPDVDVLVSTRDSAYAQGKLFAGVTGSSERVDA